MFEIGLGKNGEICDIWGMLDESLTDEVIARQTPEAQAIIRSWLAVIQRQQATISALTARVRELEEKLGQEPQTPLN